MVNLVKFPSRPSTWGCTVDVKHRNGSRVYPSGLRKAFEIGSLPEDVRLIIERGRGDRDA